MCLYVVSIIILHVMGRRIDLSKCYAWYGKSHENLYER